MTTVATDPVWVPYCGAAPLPDEWLTHWNFDPMLIAGLAAAAIGWHLAIGRKAPGRLYWFAAAFALLLVLFVSPFCALTSALFSARVVHHVLLTTVVAPLLLLSLPGFKMRVPGPLVFWTAAYALVFWAWHAPGFYALALSNDAVYWLMQGTLLGRRSASGLLFGARPSPLRSPRCSPPWCRWAFSAL
jgi:putative membrane protein